MQRATKPHAVVAGTVPSAFGSVEAVVDRLHDAGATASRGVPVERARSRLRDGRVDVLVAGGTEDGDLLATAAEHNVPCCLVTEADDGEHDGVARIVSAAGPDPVTRLIGAVHELAPDRDDELAAPEPVEDSTDEPATTDRGTPPSTDRVLDEAPVGITVSDVTSRNEPLVYVNEQFVDQTGYERSTAIGRNCRFLQGEMTDAEPVARMREAIDAGESVSVELQNYRKNGERFWQEVSLAPIRGDDGEVTHFAGFQKDITRRKRAEQAAEHHRAKLAEEREALQHLLQRIDGVLEQVTSAVVTAENRDQLGQVVCDRLSESYAAAWLGTYDPARDRVEPEWTAAPGVDQNPGESLGPVSLDSTGARVSPDGGTTVEPRPAETPRPEPALLASAVADGTVATATDIDLFDGTGAVAAIPVTYRETVFGLLCVYTDRTTTFDREEPAVLSSIGRTVGIGLNTIDSKASLVTDSAVEVEVRVGGEPAPLVALANRADCRLQQAGVVPSDDGRQLLCTAAGATVEAVQAAADAVGGIESWQCLSEREQDPLFAFDLSAFPLLDTVGSHGLGLTDLHIDGSGSTIVARGSRKASARALVEGLRGKYDQVDVRGLHEEAARPSTLTEFVTDIEEQLTDRQYRVLTVATAAGYFEWPRETTGEELAEQFGVARSTFHQHLRAALRKVAVTFNEVAEGPSP